MKLNCILTSVNDNKLYIDFIPLFVKSWTLLYPNVDIKIILIMNKLPENLLEFKNNIILFYPIKNISTAFISQYIRLLYPCILNYENGIMITDIDIIPMNKTYFTKNIKDVENNKFIYYRGNVAFEYKEIAMCYNVSLANVWKDIFKIDSLEQIKKRLIQTYKKINYNNETNNSAWCTDQLHLYKYVMKWNQNTNNLVCLNEKKTGFCRLDRNNFNRKTISDNKVVKKILNGKYSDYHCFRPFEKYKSFNNKILEILNKIN